MLKGRHGIEYPRLHEILKDTSFSLADHAAALERVASSVYADGILILNAHQRRERMALRRMVNIMRHISLIKDVDLFELGRSCPEQLGLYEECLDDLFSRADAERIEAPVLACVERTLLFVRQLNQVFSYPSPGLS